ncbi:MAG: hypothetical protein SFV51_12300 [Bryobacteraceae bacterium]|nr:hypothetical protein [Bryobacteraceae bacterium]
MFTLWTVRLACVFYVLALAAWAANRPRTARVAWTAGMLFFLLHVVAAFSFHHHWSHEAAYRETARQTAELFGFDWGGGLYFNYVFTALWALDAAWMWIRPLSYGHRPRWIAAAIHGFLAFMFFNGAIVFGSSAVRWPSVAAIPVLAAIWLGSRHRAPA